MATVLHTVSIVCSRVCLSLVSHLSQILLAVWRKRAWSVSLRVWSAWVMSEEDLSMHCLQPAICWASFLSLTDWAENRICRQMNSLVNYQPDAWPMRRQLIQCKIGFHFANKEILLGRKKLWFFSSVIVTRVCPTTCFISNTCIRGVFMRHPTQYCHRNQTLLTPLCGSMA